MRTKTLVDHQETLLWGTAITMLVVFAYIPILNNGFIADDWVILERIDAIEADPLYLQKVPPENFRTTSYFVFGFLKYAVGYRPSFYYAFNIGLHLVNTFLLLYLVWILTRDRVTAAASAAFFAVFQAPHEAVMWLAAMNETLQGLFIFSTAIFWAKGRYVLAAVSYVFALSSKESALIVLLLLPLIDLYSGRRLFRWHFALLVPPTCVFLAIFAGTWSSNFMIGSGAYAWSPGSLFVLAKSLNGLLWPWAYVAVTLVFGIQRSFFRGRMIAAFLLCAIPMLPYIFVAYAERLSSRQLYLASAVFCTVLAVLIRPVWRSRLAVSFAAVFVMYNIAYLRIRKDPAFEQRAAPTTELVKILRSEQPKHLRVEGLSPAYLSAARACTLAVPGWKPELIFSSLLSYECADCPELRWDTTSERWERSAN